MITVTMTISMIMMMMLMIMMMTMNSSLFSAKCNKMLDSTSCTDHEGEIYCKACHSKNFGPKGYGFAGGASGLSMDTGNFGEVTRE